MTDLNSKRPLRFLVFGLAVTLLAFAVLWMARPQFASGAPHSAPPVTRQQVIDAAKQQTEIVRRADRLESKLTTWKTLATAYQAANPGISSDHAKPPLGSTAVWIVAVGGDFVPQLSHARHFQWGVIVTDAVTGAGLATFAGDGSAWPSFFVGILDEGP